MENELQELRPAPVLALVVPCYNEEDTLPSTMDALTGLLDDCKKRGIINMESYAIYIDDGSRDKTWGIIASRHAVDKFCHGLKFAGNAGHQNAVWAGMELAERWRADCIISLDADLQDDIGVIPEMIDLYCHGCDIVYGVRNNRDTDAPLKRITAELFYSFMHRLDISAIPDHADFRLVGKQVLGVLKDFGEHNLFLRGIFPAMGFKSGKVYYARQARLKGQSKYPFLKSLALAWAGVTSCSSVPLRLAGLMSLICMAGAFVMSLAALYNYMTGFAVQGWTSMIIISLLLGGVQLFCLSVIGEYLAKVFTEVRHRPRYIVQKII